MPEIVRWSLFVALIMVGWIASQVWGETAKTIARRMAVGCAVVLGIVVVTGLLRAWDPWITDLHAATASHFGSLTWLGVPLTIGTLLERRLRRRPWSTIVQSWVLLSVLIVGWSATVTGYLGPTNNFEIDEETRNRFVVMHLFFLPMVTAGLLFSWWRCFRVRREEQPVLDELTVVEG